MSLHSKNISQKGFFSIEQNIFREEACTYWEVSRISQRKNEYFLIKYLLLSLLTKLEYKSSYLSGQCSRQHD